MIVADETRQFLQVRVRNLISANQRLQAELSEVTKELIAAEGRRVCSRCRVRRVNARPKVRAERKAANGEA